MDQKLFEQAFHHARLKIQRANRHVDEAQHWFRAYTESDFYEIVDNRDLETGEQTIQVKTKPLPPHLVLAIGDAFHCLSSSLDYVMSGLMKAKTGDATRIHFPTDESRKALRDSFMAPRPGRADPPRRRIVKAFPLIALDLLSTVKPYLGGNFALWEIRKADNIDKHNLIIPSVAVTELSEVTFHDEICQNTLSYGSIKVGAGGSIGLGRYAVGSFLELQHNGGASASISFSKSMEVFAGEAVFPTLLKCSQFVAETINRLESIAKRYL